MDIKAQIQFIVDGGCVSRYHTNDAIKPQTLAAHGFGTAMLVWCLTGGACRKELIMAALVDDLAEQITGDMPSPAKRRIQGLRTTLKGIEADELHKVGLHFHGLTENEKRVLSLADALDGLLFCVRERQRGNTLLNSVADTFYNYANELHDQEIATERRIFETVVEMWIRALKG